MNSRQIIIGSLVALLVVLSLAMALSLGAIFVDSPLQAGQGPNKSLQIPLQAIPEVALQLGSAPYEQDETETKTAPASGALELDNQIGNTVINGANVQEVQVRATRRARGGSAEAAAEELKRLQVDVSQRAGKVVVSAHNSTPQRMGVGQASAIDLEVTVPYETALALRPALGNLRVNGVRSSVAISSSMGNVQITDVQGDIDVTANLGNVEIDGAKIARTLQVTDKMGQISFHGELPSRGEGSITANLGNVEVELPGNSSAGFDVSAKLGKIRSDYPGDLSSNGPGGHFTAAPAGGGFLLHVQNQMGNVDLKKAP